MENLETVICNLESNLQKTNNQLNNIMWKMETFEEYMSEADEVNVGKLLEKVIKMRKDYENLQAEVVALKNLQKETFAAVVQKLQEIREQQEYLRDKILQKNSF